MSAERDRLHADPGGSSPWRHWGPYLSERAWGTVREDYSADGNAWDFFPHDHARSRAYRWNEDGLAGICDDRQLLCFALAFWNGRDPILKERAFGLSGPQGNHGEDVKEYWWYLDSTPTHSWMRWRYMYPQAAFPYERLVEENRRRSKDEPEFELLDTGVFDDRRRVRQGGARGHPAAHHRAQCGTTRRHAARAAHAVVSQHVVVGARRAPAADHAGRRGAGGRA
jgi:hypothetical protein